MFICRIESLNAAEPEAFKRVVAAAVVKCKQFTTCRLPAATDPARDDRCPAEEQHRNGGRMLYLIGLGLGDASDITVKGLQALRSCSRVYLEAYTSVLTVGKEVLVSPAPTSFRPEVPI